METIDIQNRSFVVRWVKCSHGDTITYQLRPLKKSIELGIYKKLKSSVDEQSAAVHIAPNTRAVLDYTSRALQSRTNSFSAGSGHGSTWNNNNNTNIDTSSNNHNNNNTSNNTLTNNDDSHSASHNSLSISGIQQQSQEGSLRDRLSASGFTLVKWVGHIDGNQMTEGMLDVKDNDYYYAFILDNTSAKNAKKKVLFKASVIDDDVQSMISSRSAPSPTVSSFQLSTYQKDAPLLVEQGRYLQGYLLKKRRKKLQGFKRRFFTLDFRYGTLSYYMNDHNQTRRGEIVINLSTVSANKRDKLIIIDSGMEIWALKTKDTQSWQTWVDALQSCFETKDDELQPEGNIEQDGIENAEDTDEQLFADDDNNDDDFSDDHTYLMTNNETTSKDKNDYIPLPNQAYEDFDSNLKLIQQRLELCKKESLLYSPNQKDHKPYLRHRSSSSSSSVILPNRVKMMSPVSPTSSSEAISLIGGSESNSKANNTNEHDLYKKLAELEELFNQFVRQSRRLTKDHTFMTRKITDQKCPSIFSDFSDNEEFFDANENVTPGVIMLDDEDADDQISLFKNEKKIAIEEVNFTKMDDAIDKISDKERSVSPLTIKTNVTNVSDKKSRKSLIKVKDDLYPLPISSRIERRNDIAPATSTPPSLLSFLRKNVGKDLSSIAMPITSNEPITILQMISETFEYSQLLSQLKSHNEPLTIVSAFAVSFLSIYRDKTRTLRKPFNPLLGETFELVREDMGFRLIAEKVSHKPQIFAFYAEHEDWECSYTVTPVQKFWGKSVEFNNEGTIELKSKVSGEYFEWAQPTTMLKGLIAGERYVEPVNEFEVISSKSGKVTVTFEKTGMFGGRSEGVSAVRTLVNKKSNEKILEGKWTDHLKDVKSNKIIWKAGELVKNPAKKYGYTKFTANLNEISSLEKDKLAPTDSRLRPDIKAYEKGKNQEAETLKLKLEQEQRERRQAGRDVKPLYFTKTSTSKWVYKKGSDSYWERRRRNDWTNANHLW